MQDDQNVPSTFETIDEHVQGSGLDALFGQAAAEAPVSKTARLLAAYAAVRPILSAVSVLPLIPTQWRIALRVFIAALDEMTSTGTGIAPDRDFKAGKDL
jgi:hypothetical protein